MAKGYWIGRVDVQNEDGYKTYAAANPAIFKKFGGRFVVRAGKFENPEGDRPLPKCGDRISRLRRRARMLPLARISGEYQGAAAALGPRYHHHRRLRRPAAVRLAPVAFFRLPRYTRRTGELSQWPRQIPICDW